MWGKAPGLGGCLGRGRDDESPGEPPAIPKTGSTSCVPVRLLLGVGALPFLGQPQRPICPQNEEELALSPGGQASHTWAGCRQDLLMVPEK